MKHKEIIEKLLPFDFDNCSITRRILYDTQDMCKLEDAFTNNRRFIVICGTPDEEICIDVYDTEEEVKKDLATTLEETESSWSVDCVIDLHKQKRIIPTHNISFDLK